MDIGIYRIDKTNIADIRAEFGDNPLSEVREIKSKVEYTENAICYKNVEVFDPNGNHVNLYEIVKKASQVLLKHFK